MNMNYRNLSIIEKEKIQEYIKNNYKFKNSIELSKELNLSYNTIAKIKSKLQITKKICSDIYLSPYQHELILGGILGDGNIKNNGQSGCYYRESHSILEQEYLMWKYNMMYPYTTNKIYNIPSRNGYNPQISFQTINSPTFKKYKELSIEYIINNIGELGLYIFFLDDGWISKSYYKEKLSSCSFNISGGILNDYQKELLCKRFYDILRIELHIVGQLEKNFLIPVKYNDKFVDGILKYFNINIDIIQKKIVPYIFKRNMGFKNDRQSTPVTIMKRKYR